MKKFIITYRPMKMEQTECSEMLAYKNSTPENQPEESVQHSEHGESLKSRNQKGIHKECKSRLTLGEPATFGSEFLVL
jgi:UPF0288 family protein (methanogenesis marker protein 3)